MQDVELTELEHLLKSQIIKIFRITGPQPIQMQIFNRLKGAISTFAGGKASDP